ncbi:MAG: thioredoxin domain-containing protein [Patescibacteria group bacterium]
MTKEVKIMTLVFIMIFGGLGFLISRNNNGAPTPATKDQLIRPTSHSTVNPDAKVNIVEFGDFQCPACAAAFPIVEQLLALYKDNPQVNFVSRNFPLSQHQYALLTAEAAEAAGAQEKYWEMYRLIYANYDEWVNSADPTSILVGYATQLKLDVSRFKSEVAANKYSAIIEQDKQDGLAIGINSTPTFFINGIKEVGIQNFADFKARVDAALAQ